MIFPFYHSFHYCRGRVVNISKGSGVTGVAPDVANSGSIESRPPEGFETGTVDKPVPVPFYEVEFNAVKVRILAHLVKPAPGILIQIKEFGKSSLFLDDQAVDPGKSDSSLVDRIDIRLRIYDREIPILTESKPKNSFHLSAGMPARISQEILGGHFHESGHIPFLGQCDPVFDEFTDFIRIILTGAGSQHKE